MGRWSPGAWPDTEFIPPDPHAPGAQAPFGGSVRLPPGAELGATLRGTLGMDPALGTGLRVILPDSVRRLGSYSTACSGATTSSEGGTCSRSLIATSVAFSSQTHECNDTTLVRPTSWISTTMETVALSCGEYREYRYRPTWPTTRFEIGSQLPSTSNDITARLLRACTHTHVYTVAYYNPDR